MTRLGASMARALQRVGPGFLPFADAATATLPIYSSGHARKPALPRTEPLTFDVPPVRGP